MANKAVRLPIYEARTFRKDNWWVGPAITFIVLTSFIVYTTYRGLVEAKYFMSGPYLSPLASPFFDTTGWGIPGLTPATLILPFPGAFRFTCYYYRKAYYRSFAMTPPACAVAGRASSGYEGERKLMIFQNLHRFALYFALLFLVFLWHDFVKSLSFNGQFHFGVGSLVIFLNCTFLTLYTTSCHSFRHLVGGSVNSYSEEPLGMLRHKIWNVVSKLNGNHMAFAWVSLFGVALCDLYIRMCAAGVITDLRLI